MQVIADSDALNSLCQRLQSADFVTVDTEFLRDNTYWPKLCLIQLGGPEGAAAIDPLAEGIDLTPVIDLFDNEALLKVFHSARQDLEIFYHAFDRLPHPIFDTQIAAMVCGFGDSVGYDTLVKRLTGQRIDKGPRFTDWSARPLSKAQIRYALDDVIHLRDVYGTLAREMKRRGRSHWLREEMEILTSPDTYKLDPETAVRRLKSRSGDRQYLAILGELATWREREAQTRDVPRNRVLRDEQLFDIAAQRPRTPQHLAKTRGIKEGLAKGRLGQAIMAAVERGLAIPPDRRPRPPARIEIAPEMTAVVDMLKILLKMKCAREEVATKIVANGGDLERIAAGESNGIPALAGWRRELFGEDALRLRDGNLALKVRESQVELLELEKGDSGA
jgi:ribonuclease D